MRIKKDAITREKFMEIKHLNGYSSVDRHSSAHFVASKRNSRTNLVEWVGMALGVQICVSRFISEDRTQFIGADAKTIDLFLIKA